MFLLTSLLLGVLLAANACPPDPINCTIPYDDLNISSAVIINATQYCHVDNCTVKIINTGDELNITYHNDQYHLSCTTTKLQLLEINDNINNYCEQEEDAKQSIVHIIADYAVIMIACTANILILIVIMKQKKYSILPFRLLMVSTAFWMTMNFVTFIFFLTKHTIQTSNGVCIAVILTGNSLLHCANFIETEIVVTIFYTFYRCYKMYSVLSEEAVKKLFWRLIAIAFGVNIILSTSRLLAIILQEASYVTPAGYCIALSVVYGAAPIQHHITMTLYVGTVIVQIIFSVCSAILLRTLSKNNNSTQAHRSHKCLLKIAVILSSVSLASGVVYSLAIYFVAMYSVLIGTFVGICERYTILCMLLNKDKIKRFCKYI